MSGALNPSFADIVDRMVSRLKLGGAGQSAPAPGEPMPPFLLPDQDGRLTNLEDLLSRGPAVISFHRIGVPIAVSTPTLSPR